MGFSALNSPPGSIQGKPADAKPCRVLEVLLSVYIHISEVLHIPCDFNYSQWPCVDSVYRWAFDHFVILFALFTLSRVLFESEPSAGVREIWLHPTFVVLINDLRCQWKVFSIVLPRLALMWSRPTTFINLHGNRYHTHKPYHYSSFTAKTVGRASVCRVMHHSLHACVSFCHCASVSSLNFVYSVTSVIIGNVHGGISASRRLFETVQTYLSLYSITVDHQPCDVATTSAPWSSVTIHQLEFGCVLYC